MKAAISIPSERYRRGSVPRVARQQPRLLLRALTRLGALFAKPKSILATLCVAIILILFVRVSLEILSDLNLALPTSCFGKGDDPITPCEQKILRFYQFHDFLLRHQWLEIVSLLRRVIVMCLGIAVPLVYYATHIESAPVRRVMRPYFYLITVHGLCLLVAQIALGSGVLPLVGAFFSFARTLQLLFLGQMNTKYTNDLSLRPEDAKSTHVLQAGILSLGILWLANALYLLTWVIAISLGLLGIGLTPVYT